MQNWAFSNTVLRFMAIVGVLAGMLTILGCPSDEEEEVRVAAADLTVDVNSTTVRALEGIPFTLPPGAFRGTPALANQQTTVTFRDTATIPTGTIIAPNGTATGRVTFASCNFTITASTIPGVAVGSLVPVNPCQFTVRTGLVPVGQATTVQILLALNLTPSAAQQANVIIEADGTVTVNGIDNIGTVTLVITGAAGG